MSDAYYFQHDFNARRDPKCSALINDLGPSGYGVYWFLVEIIHEQGGRIEKFPKLLEGLSYELKIPTEQLALNIHALVNDYRLLQEDENYIWSNRAVKNLEERWNKYAKKSEAGRIGGLRSGEVRKTKQNEAPLEANEQKERKGKERKVNNHPKLPADLSIGFQQKADLAKKRGFNIYQLTNKYLKGKAFTLPEAVLNKVLDRFLSTGDTVKEAWPYFLTVMADESKRHNAAKNEAEGDNHKKQPVSLGEILSCAAITRTA
jgi:hypothetical protein